MWPPLPTLYEKPLSDAWQVHSQVLKYQMRHEYVAVNLGGYEYFKIRPQVTQL